MLVTSLEINFEKIKKADQKKRRNKIQVHVQFEFIQFMKKRVESSLLFLISLNFIFGRNKTRNEIFKNSRMCVRELFSFDETHRRFAR